MCITLKWCLIHAFISYVHVEAKWKLQMEIKRGTKRWLNGQRRPTGIGALRISTLSITLATVLTWRLNWFSKDNLCAYVCYIDCTHSKFSRKPNMFSTKETSAPGHQKIFWKFNMKHRCPCARTSFSKCF